jgi:hypothetical protein
MSEGDTMMLKWAIGIILILILIAFIFWIKGDAKWGL